MMTTSFNKGGEVEMTNEEAIKWLENLKQDIGQLRHENLWPYAQAIDEIIDMLEEQEAVEPIEVFKKGTNCYEYYCKRCGNKVGTILGSKHSIFPGVKLSIEHFCDVCGQAVRWSE